MGEVLRFWGAIEKWSIFQGKRQGEFSKEMVREEGT